MICKKCKEEKAPAAFSHYTYKGKKGRRGDCKDCRASYMAAYFHRDPEKRKPSSKLRMPRPGQEYSWAREKKATDMLLELLKTSAHEYA